MGESSVDNLPFLLQVSNSEATNSIMPILIVNREYCYPCPCFRWNLAEVEERIVGGDCRTGWENK